MTIYIRTDEGQQAAYSPESAMPRKLRSLLKVIDGKTSTEVYVRSLHAFGNVIGVLESLEMAGLITPVAGTSADASAKPSADTGPAEGAPPRPAVAPSQWSQTVSHPSMAPAEPASQSWIARALGQAESPSAMSTMMVNTMVSAEKRAQALMQAKESMASFVLAHSPENAFSVLSEVDDINSLEQLAATLGGYAQLISNAGPASQSHIQFLKQILQENL